MFCPGGFTLQQPWGKSDPPQPNFEIPLDENGRIMHITHFDAAEAIIRSGYKAQQKKASCRYTYVYDKHTKKFITGKEKCLLYDGYYSWWSIELYDKEYDPDSLRSQGSKSFLFDKFSMYGTVKLSLKLCDLIESYAKSQGKRTKDVRYKVGGTLRYRREVCYVIVICVDTDDRLSNVKSIKRPQSLVI